MRPGLKTMTFEDFLLEARPTRAATVEAWGGGGKGRAKLARRVANLPADAALPKKGTAERRRYDAAMRALQRAEPGVNPKTGRPKQFRSGNKTVNRRVEEIIQKERRGIREERKLQEGGGRIVITAEVKISQSRSQREFDVALTSDEWKRVIGLVQQGDMDLAVDDLSQMILGAYELADLQAEITSVTRGRIIPN